MVHEEFSQIHQLIRLCYSMLENNQRTKHVNEPMTSHTVSVTLFQPYLLCLGFRRQRRDQIDGGIFVFPVFSRALCVFGQHRIHIAREDCCDWTLKELTKASHQITCCPTPSVNVCGRTGGINWLSPCNLSSNHLLTK